MENKQKLEILNGLVQTILTLNNAFQTKEITDVIDEALQGSTKYDSESFQEHMKDLKGLCNHLVLRSQELSGIMKRNEDGSFSLVE